MTKSSDDAVRKLLIVTHHRFDLWVAPEWFAENLRQEFPQLHIVRLTAYEGLEEELADAEIAFTISLRPEQFRAARKLRWIHSQAAAVHQLMFPELIKSDVLLTNSRDVHGSVVAEHVMALIFSLAKKIPEAVRFQSKHSWGQEQIWNGHPRPREIAGAVLGMVGFGSIGRTVARHASALGMKVVCVREHASENPPQHIQAFLPPSRLHEMLAQSDFVVLAPPLTPATEGMIGPEELAVMKPDGCLINVGRGPLIRDEALVDALRHHRIGGAALDVFEKEPLPADSPYWDLENVLITPHTAGLTSRMWERHYALFSENLRRYLSGKPLLAVVDKTHGY